MWKKLEALSRVDKGEPLKKIAYELGVGTSTVSDWKKNRKTIEDFWSKSISNDSLDDRRNVKKAKLDTLDEALFVWFCTERDRGLPISGPIIQQKALQLNAKLPDGDPDFTASQGWLNRWKTRHGVRQLTVTGESISSDKNAAEKFQKEFEEFIKTEELTADQIYNTDESGLLYRMLPNKTLASKLEESAKGYKKSKDRLTIMACSNASGKHKFPLLLIGKSKNPRALSNINRKTLPVIYRSQTSSWMNCEIFKEWFFDYFVPGVTKYLKACNLPIKAVLLIDNAPSHPEASELTKGNITVKFFPPNVTALVQPMDQGVLQNIKKVYKRHMLNELLEGDGERGVVEILKSINIKKVIYMIAESWNQVAESTLRKSWKTLWLTNCDLSDNKLETEAGISENEREIKPEDFVSMFQKIDGCSDVDISDINNWLETENNEGCASLTDDEIIALCTTAENENEDDTDENTIINDDQPKVISHSEATSHLEQLMVYFERQVETTPNELLMLKRMRDRAARKRYSAMVQQKITNFTK